MWITGAGSRRTRLLSIANNPSLPGSYQVTATVVSASTGKRTRETVGFDVQTCDFNRSIVITIP